MFEKENITTEDPKLEMMLTIFASMAQEESKSISENVKWGVRNRMKRGVVHYYKNMLGYDKNEDGTISVNLEEKEIILKIFNLYISGYTLKQIAKVMMENNYLTGTGKSDWKVAYIGSILKNEKYCGDVLLQKTVCRDFLTHKREKNDGYEQQYLIRSDNHEAIVPRHIFEYVQNLRKYRDENKIDDALSATYVNPFAKLLFCEHCLRPVSMVTYHIHKPWERKVLTCKAGSTKSVNYVNCSSYALDYQLALLALKEAYMQITNYLLKKES